MFAFIQYDKVPPRREEVGRLSLSPPVRRAHSFPRHARARAQIPRSTRPSPPRSHHLAPLDARARDTCFPQLPGLKRAQLDANIEDFRCKLLDKEIDEARKEAAFQAKRAKAWEDKLIVAKLFQQVAYSGHNLLTWSAACGNTEAVNCLLDHGGE